ncbi:GGDEF domain-containing protein [Peribacillus saganii]|uniref:GGDEF domain-containing protein n=1 Tax=Peribacillus saganii TaxID=2303992 RepID=A0A372LTG8_9BACI|nr:GGDEF domain-containing protein [Peribacillus saganii]RFU71489.1 GGDEF domain-containing protein [Peribacillus saganii]
MLSIDRDSAEISFAALKRKLYLITIPFISIAVTSVGLFSPFDSSISSITSLAIAIVLIIVWFLYYRNLWMNIAEKIMIGFLTIMHLERIYSLTEQLGNHSFNFYVVWFPLFFIGIFITMPGNAALIYSLIIYIITLVIGFKEYEYASLYPLFHFYISNLIYIIVLYYFLKILSVYMESFLLKKMAFQDLLTDVGNRRMLDIWIQNEINRSNEQDSTFSIIYFDIDNYKQINDLYGHEVGDSVLKEVASIVKRNIYDTDFFGRWGGDEFIIVSTNQSAEGAIQLADRLRIAVNNYSFSEVDTVTASFGISSIKKGDEAKTMLKRADHALYSAKVSGKNRVMFSFE